MGATLAFTLCRGGIPPLTREQVESFRPQVPEWVVQDEAHRIERTYRFKNFAEAFVFVRKTAEVAEAERHHPDISFGWGCDGVAPDQEDQRPARERLHRCRDV